MLLYITHMYILYIYMGKLQYFANLNSSAIKEDGFLTINQGFPLRENCEVGLIYSQKHR